MASGNTTHEKGFEKITEILSLMDQNDKEPSKPKNKEKLMELIYEVQKEFKFKFYLIY